MRPMFLVLALAGAVAAAMAGGCVSTSDHESLERRYRLLQIEKSNALHARDALQKELVAAKATITELEGRLTESRDAQHDRQSALKDLKAQLGKAERQAATLDQKLERIRVLIGDDGRVDTKQEREELMQALAPEKGAPVPEAAGTTH